MCPTITVEYGSKISFLQLCYLIIVEHEKCSEMCVRIVRFGQNKSSRAQILASILFLNSPDISQKFFFQLCNLNRVEHEKCSEMCVWIVKFR